MEVKPSYFQFKTFRIDQERCGQKVSTDACILGAWVPIREHVHRVLDIGCGTGLLSLMLATRNANICVDAVEIDAAAAAQAKENVEHSIFHDRCSVHHCDIAQYSVQYKYDLIVCNPPFFDCDLKGNNHQRNLARHNDTLSWQLLTATFERFLTPEGYAAILLPPESTQNFSAIAQPAGWQPSEQLFIRHTVQSPVKRIVSTYEKTLTRSRQENELAIKDQAGDYTSEFKDLLRPFYLFL